MGDGVFKSSAVSVNRPDTPSGFIDVQRMDSHENTLICHD